MYYSDATLVSIQALCSKAETHGRMGLEAQEQIRTGTELDRSAFVRNLNTELSVATLKGNAQVFNACTCQLARVTGKAFQNVAICPHAEEE